MIRRRLASSFLVEYSGIWVPGLAACITRYSIWFFGARPMHSGNGERDEMNRRAIMHPTLVMGRTPEMTLLSLGLVQTHL